MRVLIMSQRTGLGGFLGFLPPGELLRMNRTKQKRK